jgi:hypothetical protein
MRLRILGGIVLTIVALTLSVASADASYYMRYGQAKQASTEVVRQSCSEQPSCVGWIVDQCLRRSPSRFDCLIGFLHRYEAEQTEVGFEEVCESVLHWGASPQGYIELKALGQPHCYEV